MTGTVQTVAVDGRPGPRPWRRSREIRTSSEDLQELLLPTPLEMHRVGTGGLAPRGAYLLGMLRASTLCQALFSLTDNRDLGAGKMT